MLRLETAFLILVVATVPGCRPSVVACGFSSLKQDDWHREYTADSSVSLQLPPTYQADSRVYAGHHVISFWHTAARGTRQNRFDREVSLEALIGRPPFANGTTPWLNETEAKGGRSSDPMWVNSGSSCTESIGEQNAFIQAGLLSRGVSAIERVPSVEAQWTFNHDSLMIRFEGQASDISGQQEIMDILHTVRFRAPIR
jgi:hypothetical protein